ncbi:MAG: LON peptidase substrate-binding domain-containing protein [Ferruginibacter sp.]
MTNFIPIFPLGIVVYPGEQLNLHIFEPRYKQLITECFAEKKPFGIPAVIKDQVTETGTLVEIEEVTEVYHDGKMDIKTRGLQVFRMLEVIKALPDKLYDGAIVTYPDNNSNGSKSKMQKIIQGIRQMHDLLSVKKDFKKPDKELCSYDVAHHAGLSLQEEHELLGLMNELQRQEYLVRHLAKILPLIAGMESLKEKINLNGHFKNLGGSDL